MRIITDLNESALDAVKWLCDTHKISRAEAIRRALIEKAAAEKEIREAIAKNSVLDDVFGLWKDRNIDALDYLNEVRGPDRHWSSEKGEWIYKT